MLCLSHSWKKKLDNEIIAPCSFVCAWSCIHPILLVKMGVFICQNGMKITLHKLICHIHLVSWRYLIPYHNWWKIRNNMWTSLFLLQVDKDWSIAKNKLHLVSLIVEIGVASVLIRPMLLDSGGNVSAYY